MIRFPLSRFRYDDRDIRDRADPAVRAKWMTYRAAVAGQKAAPCGRRVGFRAGDDGVVQARVAEHLDYLKNMAASGVVPQDVAAKARVVWWVAYFSVGEVLPIPAAAAFTGGPIEYYWVVGPHQLSAEIPATGLCHWSYRNTKTGEVWGADVPTDDGLPPRLEHYLQRIVASTR